MAGLVPCVSLGPDCVVISIVNLFDDSGLERALRESFGAPSEIELVGFRQQLSWFGRSRLTAVNLVVVSEYGGHCARPLREARQCYNPYITYYFRRFGS